jgi:uncharacterized membrane protein YkgB
MQLLNYNDFYANSMEFKTFINEYSAKFYSTWVDHFKQEGIYNESCKHLLANQPLFAYFFYKSLHDLIVNGSDIREYLDLEKNTIIPNLKCNTIEANFYRSLFKLDTLLGTNIITSTTITLLGIMENSVIPTLTLDGSFGAGLYIRWNNIEDAVASSFIVAPNTYSPSAALPLGLFTITIYGNVCDITDLSLVGVADYHLLDCVIGSNCRNLVSLDLSDNKLSKESIENIFIALRETPSRSGNIDVSGVDNGVPTFERSASMYSECLLLTKDWTILRNGVVNDCSTI